MSGRYTGVTLPSGGRLFALDYDEVFVVDLDDPSNFEIMEISPRDFVKGRPDVIGVASPERTTSSEIHTLKGMTLESSFDPTSDEVAVKYKVKDGEGELKFPILSGDWFSMSFSADGKYIVLAEPYTIAVYEV
ncbi:MAG: hypothetical protein AAFY34_02330 [Pseudomonadota bacterium]